MSNILLIGYHPPQLIKNSKVEAAHYRTWQFLQPLLADGHQVLLCAGAVGEKVQPEPVPDEWAKTLTHQPMDFAHPSWIQQLQAAHDRFAPDCIVAVNFNHCLYATKLRTNKPLWMDIYGDMLTIMQAGCYRQKSDRGLETTIGFMREVLRKGDLFSGCGTPQQHMLAGQLAMAGRLNWRTFGYDFTRVILPGSPPVSAGAPPTKRTFPEGIVLDEDAFVVLWCGGYNTWTDVETLFQGLEWAMARQPRLHYVSVGANTYQAVDNTYARLQALIEGSAYRQRFHLLGWRPWAEVPIWYRASDIGINIDALHYETIYGTRTRLVEMIASGLPVITTLGAELSYLLQEQEAALTFEIGDWQTLGAQLEQVAKNTSLRTRMAQAALAYAHQDLSFANTTQPLRDWVRHPRLAPDKLPLAGRQRLQKLEHTMRATVRHTLWRVRGADR